MNKIIPLADKVQGDRYINASLHKVLTVRSDNWVSDLIEALSDSVSVYIRDARTNKYLLANTCTAKLYGVESFHDLIDISFHEFWIEDVYDRKNKLHLNNVVLQWEEQERKRAEQLEAQVRLSKLPLSINRTVLKYDDSILYERLTKLPILDRNNKKIIASISFSQDLTSQINLSDLFQRYRQYYPDSTAIERLSKYLKIDSFFYQPLTLREMQLLLVLHHQPNRKKAARLLNISPNTLASHLQHIKERTLIKPDLNEIFVHLRKAPMSQESRHGEVA